MAATEGPYSGVTTSRGKTLCSLVMALALTSCAEEARVIAETGPQAPSPALARGAALYAGSCSDFCHGRGPSASEVASFIASSSVGFEPFARNAPSDAPDLFDCTWLATKSDSEIEQVIIAGIPNTRMIGFGSNFPEGKRDHAALIGYLRMASACETPSNVTEQPNSEPPIN